MAGHRALLDAVPLKDLAQRRHHVLTKLIVLIWFVEIAHEQNGSSHITQPTD